MTNTGGDCYEASAKYMMNHETEMKNGHFFLVHGIPILRTDGKPFGHAWLENEREVFDVSNGYERNIPKAVYYALGHIDTENIMRYTYTETLAHLVKYVQWGPWELKTPR